MGNQRIIAKALLDWTKNSKTTFLEANEELTAIAEKRGISLPSPDLAIFKTIYAELDVPNRNGVRLPRSAVERGLPSLVGKQINFDHEGSGHICGWILDGKIENNFIVVYGAFFKSMFRGEFEEVRDKFEKGQLFVSFEIHKYTANGDSASRQLSDGSIELHTVHFAGCGLLMNEQPACPKAEVLKLLASTKASAETIKETTPSGELIYAELAYNEDELKEVYSKVKEEKDITFDIAMAYYYSSEEEKSKVTEEAAEWTTKFINELPDDAFAAVEPAYYDGTYTNKDARHLPHHDGHGDLGKTKSNKNLDLPHYKNALARVNQIKPVTDSIEKDRLIEGATNHLDNHKNALEAKANEEGRETILENDKEIAESVTVTTEEVVTTVTNDNTETTIEQKVEKVGTVTQETVAEDGTTTKVVEEVNQVVTYTVDQMQEQMAIAAKLEADLKVAQDELNKIKSELEKAATELKVKCYSEEDLKKAIQEAKEYAQKVTARRISLGDTECQITEADLADDTKFENLTLKMEVEKLKVENASKVDKSKLVASLENQLTPSEKFSIGKFIDSRCWNKK